MTYTTHGYMTPKDMAEYRYQYDLDAWRDTRCVDCGEQKNDCTCPDQEEEQK